MASYGQAMPAARPHPRHLQQQPMPPGAAVAHGAVPVPVPVATAPHGTFAPGTKIQVGGHRVVIQKYLSEGGFAHVYLVRLPTPVDGTDLAVLKRVAVPDKDALRGMRTEVETMKRLKGHRAIVTYIDSHASELRGGGYEVFLLMEFCDGGGLMDFMNTRLQHRLTEPEIVGIFADVAEGVACMHYLKPPLLHRDLKVENVLISSRSPSSSSSSSASASSSSRRFKLCDFGSAAPPRPAPVSVVECRLVDDDVQRHTTLQYRSPEMIDVYRRQPIDEKSDIWALGVLLYKLCYYTTPFEDQSSQLAILNASYRFPSHPVFSDRLKRLIASMLQENQDARPNIYQVLREACAMQGRDVPVKDIYAARSQSEPRVASSRPRPSEASRAAPVIGAVFAPAEIEQQVIPDIVPMRRGRPSTTPAGQTAAAAAKTKTTAAAPPPKPSPEPRRVTTGDPFAALDAKHAAADELSARFPTLDQFSILHDHGTRFRFGDDASAAGSSPPVSPDVVPKPHDLGQRVAERLADDAFAQGAASSVGAASRPSMRPNASPERRAQTTGPAPVPKKPAEMSRASAIISGTPALQAAISQQQQNEQYEQPPRQKQPPVMVSTGTMTSPSPTPPPPPPCVDEPPSRKPYQIFRFPTPSDDAPPPTLQPRTRHSVLPIHIRHPSSSRPSLEGGRPGLETLDNLGSLNALDRVASAPSPSPPLSVRPRPVSTHLESSMDYLRAREGSGSGNGGGGGSGSSDVRASSVSPRPDAADDASAPIASNVEYLRAREEQQESSSRRGHLGSLGPLGHLSSKSAAAAAAAVKRPVAPPPSGKKPTFAGKFSDAFKRFEGGSGSGGASGSAAAQAAGPMRTPTRTPSPMKATPLERPGRDYDNGDGDGVSYAYAYNDGAALPEITDDMPPEVRRELERRRLSMEEKRVAAAGAEYRQRLARRDTTGGSASVSVAGASSLSLTGASEAATPPPPPLPKSIGGVSRATSIQHRVQTLLHEAESTAGVTRTAHGYGHFTDDGNGVAGGAAAGTAAAAAEPGRSASPPLPHRRSIDDRRIDARAPPPRTSPAKPAAKPKPLHLNKPLPAIGRGAGSAASAASAGATGDAVYRRSGSPTMPPPSRAVPRGTTTSTASTALTGTTATAAPTALMAVDLPGQPVLEGMTLADRDDYISDFTRRFPSLTTIEMVERDLSAEDATRR